MEDMKKRIIRRSSLEDQIESQLKKKKIRYSYESIYIKYKIPARNGSYLPDFIITTKTGKQIIIEGKGIWDYNDRYKHLLIKKQHPELDIRFVFSDSNKRIRKGSKTKYKDICEGRGRGIFRNITWKYSNKTIPEEWFEE